MFCNNLSFHLLHFLFQTKQSIVKFLTSDVLEDSQILLPLIVAAADSRFSVANLANAGLGRVVR